MDTLEIAYKILYNLENKERTEYAGQRIGPERIGTDPEKWAEVLASLVEEGYVSGVTFRENILGETKINIEKARITLRGTQYLNENSAMAKFRKVATDIITVAAGTAAGTAAGMLMK